MHTLDEKHVLKVQHDFWIDNKGTYQKANCALLTFPDWCCYNYMLYSWEHGEKQK